MKPIWRFLSKLEIDLQYGCSHTISRDVPKGVYSFTRFANKSACKKTWDQKFIAPHVVMSSDNDFFFSVKNTVSLRKIEVSHLGKISLM